MKHTIGKPENWQDFESLCKKLWGEIWKIPDEIKKNGRLGQDQFGVDVYGIPEGKKKYWGIQCKGKDEYTNAKLKEKEIIAEIEKAKKFIPELDVFIIATSSNKDSKIEQFIRLKSEESRKLGSFEILLFCWEDITDLLESHSDTYNWYLNGIGQKGKFDFKISFNNKQDNLTLKPIFVKEITSFKLTNKSEIELFTDNFLASSTLFKYEEFNIQSLYKSNKVNNSWCDFDLVMENIGVKTIDDWKIEIKFIKGIRRIYDGYPLFPILSETTYIDNELKKISYRPINNTPLHQKENRFFKASILIEHNANEIIVEWELFARDYHKKGSFEIKVEPEYIEITKIEEVSRETTLLNDVIDISDYITEKDENND